MKQRNRKRSQGFSLAEVVFAIFLLSIVASIMAATLPLANSSRARADMLNKATFVAQKEMESLRNIGYVNLNSTQLFANGLIDSTAANANGSWNFTNVDQGSGDSPARVLPSGTGTVAITQVASDLRSITVTVNWTERGRNRSVQFSSYVGNL